MLRLPIRYGKINRTLFTAVFSVSFKPTADLAGAVNISLAASYISLVVFLKLGFFLCISFAPFHKFGNKRGVIFRGGAGRRVLKNTLFNRLGFAYSRTVAYMPRKYLRTHLGGQFRDALLVVSEQDSARVVPCK